MCKDLIGEEKAIKQTDYSTCIFIYICTDNFIHLNFLKRTVQKESHWQRKRKQKDTHSTILSISTFLIIILLKEYIWGQKVALFKGDNEQQAVKRHLLAKGGLRKLWPLQYNTTPKQMRDFSLIVKRRGQKPCHNPVSFQQGDQLIKTKKTKVEIRVYVKVHF